MDSASYAITGLASGTSYDVRANLDTNFAWAEATFRTTTNNAIALTLDGSTSSPAAVDVTFGVTFTNPTARSEDVRLRYGVVAGGSVAAWTAAGPNAETGTTSTFAVTGLTPGAKYRVEASLDSAFPAASFVFLEFTAGATLAVDTDFIAHDLELIVTPGYVVAGGATSVGFRRADAAGAGGFGEVQPAELSAFGAVSSVVAVEQVGDELKLALSPCPDAWSLGGLTVTHRDGTDTPPTSSILTVDYDCAGAVATWRATGIPLKTMGDPTNASPDVAERGVTLYIYSRYITKEQPGGDGGGRHERSGLKATICALPDSILGEGYCGPLMVFLPPLILMGIMIAFGAHNPMVLGGVGMASMAGMGALVLPGPIMIVGFIIASLGAVAGVIMMRK